MQKRVSGAILIVIMVVVVAGCETFGEKRELLNKGTITISQRDPGRFGPPMEFRKDPTTGEWVYDRWYIPKFSVKEQGDLFTIRIGKNITAITPIKNGDTVQLQYGKRNIKIYVPKPPEPDPLRPTAQVNVYTQPLTRQLWDTARSSAHDDKVGRWDITQMQLYISGTVVLEHESHSTDLEMRTKDKPVNEIAQGPQYLKGPTGTDELITKSTYTNELRILQTMTPGRAFVVNGEGNTTPTVRNTLEVKFEEGPVGEPHYLRFRQEPGDKYGYFYLDYANGEKITYGGKPYEIRYDAEKTGKPYLMIRTEYHPSTDPKYLPGLPIPGGSWRAVGVGR